MPTYHLTPTETVTVREATPEALIVDATYAPGDAKGPPPHRHPHQDERFEVHEGELRVRLDGSERTLRAGDVLDIPRGTTHSMWNAGPTPVRATWRTTPAGRTEAWWKMLDDAGAGTARPGLRTLAGPLREYRDVFEIAVGPAPVVYGLLGVLALTRPGR